MKKLALIFFVLGTNIAFLQAQAPINTPDNIGAGNCLDFRFNDPDRVEVADAPALNPVNTITAECWINTVQTDPNVGIFGKWGFNDADNLLQYTYTMVGGGVIFHVSTDINTFFATSPLAYNDGMWHHVAATYENGVGINLYVDGELVATNGAASGGIRVTGVPLKIGTYAGEDGMNNHFDGQIDEVRIWNISRSQAQIRDNMCKELTGSETGLVGYWNMDEGTGGTIADMTSNSNNGILQ